MKLYIAEKPSLARAIAEAFGIKGGRHNGSIPLPNGDQISWCIGHLLEQAEPDAYDAKYKKWQLDHLPILPEKWQLQVKKPTRKQFNHLKALMRKAKTIVHAGDPDREGQLLVDEVIHHVFPTNAKRPPVERLLISDLNVKAIQKSLGQLQPNENFAPLSASALARSRADWLYGINMTRFYTIKGRQNGFKGKGVLSVGRVQTPLLGLIVRRDETIDNFQPKPFYEVTVPLLHQSGAEIIVKWQPSEACEAYMDEEKRVLSKKLCEHVIERVSNNKAEVLVFTEKVVKKSPPLPYNLSSLQIDANRQFGMSAKAVLDTCQSLYEKYKMISYPRSDCRYLPEAHFADANNIRASIQKSCAPLSNAAQQMNPALKSKAWNDKKVGAHHAIIPTLKANDKLPKQEANVYRLIARQYLLQFYPELVQKEQRLVVEINGGRFKANGLAILDLGFRKLFDDPDFGGKAKTQTDKVLPALTKGEKLPSLEGTLLEKETQPPAPFTEATLLSAMTGISRFVKQVEIKKILKETDGLGTEATRAHIIELLIKRQFIKKFGKQVRATELGKQLIASLPAYATEPDMTAQWESTLEKIAQRETSYQSFMLPLEENLTLQISRKSS